MAYYSGQRRRIARTAAQVSKEPVSLPMSDCHSPFLNLVEDIRLHGRGIGPAQKGREHQGNQQRVPPLVLRQIQTVQRQRGRIAGCGGTLYVNHGFNYAGASVHTAFVANQRSGNRYGHQLKSLSRGRCIGVVRGPQGVRLVGCRLRGGTAGVPDRDRHVPVAGDDPPTVRETAKKKRATGRKKGTKRTVKRRRPSAQTVDISTLQAAAKFLAEVGDAETAMAAIKQVQSLQID